TRGDSGHIAPQDDGRSARWIDAMAPRDHEHGKQRDDASDPDAGEPRRRERRRDAPREPGVEPMNQVWSHGDGLSSVSFPAARSGASRRDPSDLAGDGVSFVSFPAAHRARRDRRRLSAATGTGRIPQSSDIAMPAPGPASVLATLHLLPPPPPLQPPEL